MRTELGESFGAPVPERAEALVVGAGLSGLSAALHLGRQGVDVHVLEASDAVGGRIRTDRVHGFQLDRGFQILLTAYEELQAEVDLARLELRPFKPGSLIWNGHGLQRMTDPFRDPTRALASVAARVGSLRDKVRVASLRKDLLSKSAEACFRGPERSTLEELRALGFSEAFIDEFFRAFLGGVFLDRDLRTSARLFRYYFRCFSAGDAAVPAGGMQRLPELLAEPLDGRVSFDCPVVAVRRDGVTLADGTTVNAEDVIVAVDGPAASVLLGTHAPRFKATVTSYFAAPEAPIEDRLLVLDGTGDGPANHLAVMSNVAPEYAPDGEHLLAVSGVGVAARDATAFAEAVPAQMRRWFGSSVERWTHLRSYRIPHALPRHSTFEPSIGTARRPDGVVVAGDYMEFGAIQGAMLSGRRAAQAVLSELMVGSVA